MVTVGQVLSTAANLDGLEVSSVDQTGMAQKGGPVVSHLRIGRDAIDGAARLEEGRADVFLVFDLLTAVAPANMARLDPERTQAVVSTAQVPTGAMVADVDREDFPDLARLRERLEERTHERVYLDAEAVALAAFGSQPAANLVVVGVAYQRGAAPPVGVRDRTGDRAERRRGGDQHRRLPPGSRDRHRSGAGHRRTARRTSRAERGGADIVRTRRRRRRARARS